MPISFGDIAVKTTTYRFQFNLNFASKALEDVYNFHQRSLTLKCP